MTWSVVLWLHHSVGGGGSSLGGQKGAQKGA